MSIFGGVHILVPEHEGWASSLADLGRAGIVYFHDVRESALYFHIREDWHPLLQV